MKKILLFTSLAITGILFSTCDRKEEDKQPKACFSPSTSNTTVGTTIAFNNCSTDAQIYSWNFGDGTATSSEVSPSHSFASAGQFTVTLKAWYKNNVDEETQIITVTGGTTNLDPTVYDLGQVYSTHYSDDFTATGDWLEETTSDYSAVISGGLYTISNYSTTNYWTFSTSAAAMPSSSLNYDIDIWFKIGYDNQGYGDGMFWAKNPDAFSYYFYLTSPYNSTEYYSLGDVQDGTWTYWLTSNWMAGGYFSDYNHLTVRKYGNYYYFFLNETLVHTQTYTSDFGSKFGFWIAPESQIIIDGIGIWAITSKKSSQPKEFVNTSRTSGAGEVVKGLQPSISVKK
jgi:PKD repeat protein